MTTMTDISLYPVQQQIIGMTREAWSDGRPAVFCLGQRSGKSTILAQLADENPDDPVVVIAETLAYARCVQDDITFNKNVRCMGARKVAEQIAEREAQERALGRELDTPLFPPRAIIMIDEVFWIWRGEQLFNRLRYHTDRLVAIGSACDHRVPWKSWEGIPKWATWEANPNIRVEDLDEQYLQNPTAARRDFGSYKERPGMSAVADLHYVVRGDQLEELLRLTANGEGIGDVVTHLDAWRDALLAIPTRPEESAIGGQNYRDREIAALERAEQSAIRVSAIVRDIARGGVRR